MSSTGPPLLDPPTLLTRISKRPKRSKHTSIMSETASPFVASQICVLIFSPKGAQISSVSVKVSWLLSTASIDAPSSINRYAIDRPLPHPGPTQPAPVIIATLSCNLFFMIYSLKSCYFFLLYLNGLGC